MERKTDNYVSLLHEVTTEREALMLDSVMCLPSTMLERADNMMQLFYEQYFENEKAHQNLLGEIKLRPHLVKAMFNVIWDIVAQVSAMLLECCNYNVEVAAKEEQMLEELRKGA